MVLDFLVEYQIPIIVGICLCIGYIVKKWVKDVDNKWIPTICGVAGLIFAMWINGWNITPQVVLQGLFSGLSATGLHQAFKQIIENSGKKSEEVEE